jgi:uncharacterized membrane protein YgdD (TMEM256/DUF423 family)
MIRTAAILGFLAVALGAFGAHGLKERLEAADRMATWETAVLYHLVHSVVLLVLALARPQAVGAFRCMAAGILVFSGTLYALCLTGQTWLGAVTPIGGLLLLSGWALLAWKAGPRR